RAGSGKEQSSPNTPSSAAERSVGLSRGSIANPLFVRGVGWHHRDAQRTRALWGQDAVTTKHFGVTNWVQKLLELAHGICTPFLRVFVQLNENSPSATRKDVLPSGGLCWLPRRR